MLQLLFFSYCLSCCFVWARLLCQVICLSCLFCCGYLFCFVFSYIFAWARLLCQVFAWARQPTRRRRFQVSARSSSMKNPLSGWFSGTPTRVFFPAQAAHGLAAPIAANARLSAAPATDVLRRPMGYITFIKFGTSPNTNFRTVNTFLPPELRIRYIYTIFALVAVHISWPA